MELDANPRALAQLTAEIQRLRLNEDLEEVLLSVLSRACGALAARSMIALYYDSDSEQLRRWECFRDGRAPVNSEVDPALVRSWITLGRGLEKETVSEGSEFCRLLGAIRILSVRFPSGVNCARLLGVDPQTFDASTLDELAELALALAPLLDRLYSLVHIRQRAIEDERDRIAQDFHDGPLQTFLALNVQLEFIRHLLSANPAGAAAELNQLQEAMRKEVRELRELLQGMRPIDLDRTGLTGLLRQLADELQKAGDLSVRFIHGGGGREPSSRISRELFQIVREAATNARKHGAARHIVITTESDSEAFRVSIDDDGRGFQFSGRYRLEELDTLRLGPVSIKQRVHRIGASLDIESNPGHGCRLIIRVPHGLPEEGEAAAGPAT